MKVSGCTIGRNVVKYDYPIVEAITSILPIVDEFIVNVGDSKDVTLQLVEGIRSPKIKIIRTVWDMSRSRDGQMIADQMNIALSHCTGDWAVFLHADEVVHEADHPHLVDAMARHLHNPRILALKFRFLHFFGDYWTVDPWSHHTEIRIVRAGGHAAAVGDGSGFSATQDGAYLKRARGRWAWSGGRIFHYGYVKRPEVMMAKAQELMGWCLGGRPAQEAWEVFQIRGLTPEQHRAVFEMGAFPFLQDYDMMKNYRGSHPAVMQGRLAGTIPLKPRRNRWLAWRFYRQVARHGFKG